MEVEKIGNDKSIVSNTEHFEFCVKVGELKEQIRCILNFSRKRLYPKYISYLLGLKLDFVNLVISGRFDLRTRMNELNLHDEEIVIRFNQYYQDALSELAKAKVTNIDELTIYEVQRLHRKGENPDSIARSFSLNRETVCDILMMGILNE